MSASQTTSSKQEVPQTLKEVFQILEPVVEMGGCRISFAVEPLKDERRNDVVLMRILDELRSMKRDIESIKRQNRPEETTFYNRREFADHSGSV